jgi:hypothetical protein
MKERVLVTGDAGFLSRMISCLENVLLSSRWGMLAAAYTLLASNVARSTGRWMTFLAIVARQKSKASSAVIRSDFVSAPLARVFQQFIRSARRNLLVEQLDEGVESDVFMVRSRDGYPLWQTHQSLVIKLYKPAVIPSFEVARKEFDALSRMHTTLNGLTISGWRICTPLPLYLCKSPLAFVMTLVPGRRLEACLETGDNLIRDALETMPRAVVAAMGRCWSMGRLHGDLHIENILCDFAARDLSFIDAGVPVSSFAFCDIVTKRWYPASHDLGYMLYNTSVRFRSTIGTSAARFRQQNLVERILRIFVETVDPFDQKQQLLDEIEACARAHLKSLELTWSLSALWHVFLRRVASRYIDTVINTLRTQERVPHEAASGSKSSDTPLVAPLTEPPLQE